MVTEFFEQGDRERSILNIQPQVSIGDILRSSWIIEFLSNANVTLLRTLTILLLYFYPIKF